VKIFFSVAAFLLMGGSQLSAESTVRNIGSRWELFVDRFLIDSSNGVELKLNRPERREVVLVTDAPWEDSEAAYYSIIQDGDKVRIYYRGACPKSDLSHDQVTCVAESADGIHFTRPNLGLIEVKGSKENNIIWLGIESHNFAPLLDTNPNCRPEEKYKALGGIAHPGKNWLGEDVKAGLYAFTSADGIHWKKLRNEPVITDGAFDSLNIAFWDAPRNQYVCYSRTFTGGVRTAQSSTSPDFVTWIKGRPNQYKEGVPLEHFYTTSTIPCPGAEHLFVAFPKRFIPDRKKVTRHNDVGVSDAVFMSSRDGIHWDRPFLEAWVRPGLDERNWTDRNNMTAYGVAEVIPGEWSFYISEHYRWPDNRLRRLSLPRHRFASAHADAKGGEFTTPPILFQGEALHLNYSTSAAGHIQIELLDENGSPMAGFNRESFNPQFGDELDAIATWKGESDLSKLSGKVIRLHVFLHDADLYAIRFGSKDSSSKP
jgi:hypothetical protein